MALWASHPVCPRRWGWGKLTSRESRCEVDGWPSGAEHEQGLRTAVLLCPFPSVRGVEIARRRRAL